MKTSSTGVLLVDKPQGLSSHAVVQKVRRAFGQREVGHTGTLDPMATGLMVVLLGRATRVARFVEATEKAYEGTVALGSATTTFDAEGETTETSEVPALDRGAIERALAGLVGEIEQEVPIFSAVKVDGERLYRKARRGEAVEAPRRVVTVYALEAARIALPEIDVFVRCSKGTYVRTLAVQIGRAVGLPAHLSRLRRTRVGAFAVADAIPVDRLTGGPEELLPLTAAVAHLPQLEVDAQAAEDVRHGRPLSVREVGPLIDALGLVRGAPLALVRRGDLLAVAEARIGAPELAGAAHSDRAVGYACVLVSR